MKSSRNAHRVLPLISMLGLVLIAGCGGGSTATPPAGSSGSAEATPGAGSPSAVADAGDDAFSKVENFRADCMKQQGFTYIPRPSLPNGGKPQASAGAGAWKDLTALNLPDDELRPLRQKYGFGDIARVVYPNDPRYKRTMPKIPKDPNLAVIADLDSARLAAYNVARWGATNGDPYDAKDGGKSAAREKKYNDSCEGRADKVGYRPDSAKQKAADAAENENARKIVARYKSDPAVVAATDQYADCLKGRGYAPLTGDATGFPLTLASRITNDNSPSLATAKRLLPRDIRAALDDLDCRAPYADLVRAKYPEVANGSVDTNGSV